MAGDDEIYRDGLRGVHGRQAQSHVGPVIETPPGDEQKPGVPAPAAPAVACGPKKRRANGTVTPEGARELSRKKHELAARDRAFAEAVVRLRVVPDAPENSPYSVRQTARPFAQQAEALYRAKTEELARDVGGGQLGAGVLSVVRGWAHQASQSALFFELAAGPLGTPVRGGKVDTKAMLELTTTASRLADAARQSLLAAHHLARLEALSRRERTERDPVVDMRTRILGPAEGDDS